MSTHWSRYHAALRAVNVELPAKLAAAKEAADAAAAKKPADLTEASKQQKLGAKIKSELEAARAEMGAPIVLEQDCRQAADALAAVVSRHTAANSHTCLPCGGQMAGSTAFTNE